MECEEELRNELKKRNKEVTKKIFFTNYELEKCVKSTFGYVRAKQGERVEFRNEIGLLKVFCSSNS